MLLKIQQTHFLLKLFQFEEKLRILIDLLLYWKKSSRALESLMYKRNLTNWVTTHGQSFKVGGGSLCSGVFLRPMMLFLVLV